MVGVMSVTMTSQTDDKTEAGVWLRGQSGSAGNRKVAGSIPGSS